MDNNQGNCCKGGCGVNKAREQVGDIFGKGGPTAEVALLPLPVSFHLSLFPFLKSSSVPWDIGQSNRRLGPEAYGPLWTTAGPYPLEAESWPMSGVKEIESGKNM